MTESGEPQGAPIVRLRYPGRCALCDVALAVNSKAWHDPGARRAHCLRCGEGIVGADDPVLPEALPQASVDGVAGTSAQASSTVGRRHGRDGFAPPTRESPG